MNSNCIRNGAGCNRKKIVPIIQNHLHRNVYHREIAATGFEKERKKMKKSDERYTAEVE